MGLASWKLQDRKGGHGWAAVGWVHVGGVSLLKGSEAPAWRTGCEGPGRSHGVQVPRSSEGERGPQDTAAACPGTGPFGSRGRPSSIIITRSPPSSR